MNQTIFKRRVVVTGLLIFSIACFFIYRLFDLHFSEKIKISSHKNTEKRRGYIKDKNGYILAISTGRDSLFVNPEQIENSEYAAKTLSPILGYSVEFIFNRVARKKRFVWLKRKLEEKDVQIIKDLNIKGLHFQKEYHRVYPHGNLASNVLGFVDVDNNGIEGIEYKFNDILSGNEKTSIFSGEKRFINGSNISLTIDRFIQDFCEDEIKNGVKKYNAKRGVVVALEVKTGRILALAVYPSFDPNYYYKYSNDLRGNYTVVNSFEPGSTLKIIAAAAILKYYPKAFRVKYICKGSIDIGDVTVKCGRPHGHVNMVDILNHSCNVGIMQAIKNVDSADFFDILKKFGFGKKLGLELPGESNGILRHPESWSGLSKYSISIGQEIAVTSLQLTAAYGAIANEGVYLFPTIIEKIEKDDGSIAQSFFPISKGRIISKNIAKKLQAMMRKVVTDGTGGHANVDCYAPAGKTGTAQKFMRTGGYLQNKYVTSFIGTAPWNNPDICVLVLLDEPEELNSGGEVAAPIFARIVERILPYRGVKTKKIIAKDPYRIKPGEKKFNGKSMPNFKGQTLSQSIELLLEMQKKLSVKYFFIGQGRVYKQTPNPNSKLSGKQQIALYFREQ